VRDDHAAPSDRAAGLSVGDVRRRAFSGSVLLAGKGVVVQVLGLASTVLIAHYLTPGELGKVAFGITLTTVLAFVGGSQGLAGALIRRKETLQAADLETALGLQLAVGMAIAIVVTAVAWPLGEVGQLTAVMVWAIPVAAFRVPAQAVLERELAYRRIVSAEVFELLCFQAWQIGTVLAGWGVWGLATAVLCRALSGTIVLILLSRVRHLRPRFDRERSRRLLGLGLKIQATDLVDGLRDQGVNIAAGTLGGLSVLGLWTMAYRALQLPAMVFTSLFRVSLPAMSRMLALGKDPRPLIEDALALVAPSFGLVLVPLAASSPALFPAVLGEDWAGAAGVVPPACLGYMLVGPAAIAAVGYLWAIGDGNVPLRGAVFNLIAWFAVSLPLLPFVGAPAIGFGMLAAYVVQTVTLIRGVRRHVRVSFMRPLLVPLVIASAATTPVWLAASAVRPTFAVVVAAAAIAELAYLGGLFVFHRDTTRRILALSIRPLAGRRMRLAAFAAGR
jgi:O-antigen/teichoic acid export membrane protein